MVAAQRTRRPVAVVAVACALLASSCVRAQEVSDARGCVLILSRDRPLESLARFKMFLHRENDEEMQMPLRPFGLSLSLSLVFHQTRTLSTHALDASRLGPCPLLIACVALERTTRKRVMRYVRMYVYL